MIQGNVSFSKTGVLRGMHYHYKQADFWLVPSGRVLAALYDMRKSSPTRGKTQVLEMGERNPVGVYIPKGVAHGFRALADSFMTYLVDEYYDNSDENGVRWDDPALGIDWGSGAPIVSGRDQKNPALSEIPTAPCRSELRSPPRAFGRADGNDGLRAAGGAGQQVVGVLQRLEGAGVGPPAGQHVEASRSPRAM